MQELMIQELELFPDSTKITSVMPYEITYYRPSVFVCP